MIPPMRDTGGQDQASGTVVVPELETDNRNLTEPGAKVGRDQRATSRARAGSEARARSEARAEGGLRAISVREVGNVKDTNPISRGFGRQTENGSCPIGSRGVLRRQGVLHKGMYGALGALRRRVQISQVKGGGGTKPPVIHWKAYNHNPMHSGPRPRSRQMPVGVRGPGSEICSRDSRHH